jgi:hypothetical protein
MHTKNISTKSDWKTKEIADIGKVIVSHHSLPTYITRQSSTFWTGHFITLPSQTKLSVVNIKGKAARTPYSLMNAESLRGQQKRRHKLWRNAPFWHLGQLRIKARARKRQ